MKRPLGRPGRRRVCYLKMDLKGVICESVNGSHMSQDMVHWRGLVNMVPWSLSQRQ